MKVGEFRGVLLELAGLHRECGDQDAALALEKLAEVFDLRQNLKLAQILKDIRIVRNLDAA